MDLSVRSPIRSPSVFMNAAMWEHCGLDKESSWSSKIYYSDPFIINNFMQTLFLDLK
jgi:hypothetical protein